LSFLSTQAPPPDQKIKKPADFQKVAFFRKEGWTITHEKYHFLLGMDLLLKETTNLTLNFT
jgi:hypothetical protein